MQSIILQRYAYFCVKSAVLWIGGILKAYRVGFCGAIYFCDLSSLSESFDEAGLFQN